MSEYPTSLTVFRIPRSHWGCHLHNFEANDAVWTAIEEFITGESPHLILTGNPGNGKTHLSVALYRWAVSQSGVVRSFWCDFPAFVFDVKRGYGASDDVLKEVEEASDFVALDDMFGRELTPHEMESILYPCIQWAHRNQARLVVSTNYTLEQISTKLTNHELDRVLDGSRHLHFTGESRRGS